MELQKEFLSGKRWLYPVSVDKKADYPGVINDEGVPVLGKRNDGNDYTSPVMVALYGLGSHDVWRKTGDERYRQQFDNTLRWVVNHVRNHGNGIGWAQGNDMEMFGLKAPWFSCLAQGLVLSLLVRADQMCRGSEWALLAVKAWMGFRPSISEGGFTRKVEAGLIFEEYPTRELHCVFNGMCAALIGLWELWKSGIVKEAEDDFRRGVEGLHWYLTQFDYNGWSLYSLDKSLGRPFLASPYYQMANGLLAIVIGLMADEYEFRAYGERWLETSRSFWRRVLMSMFIGIERAPYGLVMIGLGNQRRGQKGKYASIK